MAREYKHYGLKRARSPRNLGPLATTIVITTDKGEKAYGYVKFSESFISAVGKRMPRGVSLHDPAFIDVAFVQGKKEWEIRARYLASGEAALLWRTGTEPSWLNIRGYIQ